uniref:Uncharacterized protein n=1 Tax=Myotis myotis TaxID=51298 RepID=A0A7J7U5F9_MYOMY|nr:hypothetical protein mMyoMyo1_008877 [Myotis myotis]
MPRPAFDSAPAAAELDPAAAGGTPDPLTPRGRPDSTHAQQPASPLAATHPGLADAQCAGAPGPLPSRRRRTADPRQQSPASGGRGPTSGARTRVSAPRGDVRPRRLFAGRELRALASRECPAWRGANTGQGGSWTFNKEILGLGLSAFQTETQTHTSAAFTFYPREEVICPTVTRWTCGLSGL